jgi:hypothetical protein
MDSLTPQQRQELGELMQGAMDLDLQAQMAQLGDSCATPGPTCPGAVASGCAASRAWGWATRRRRSRSSPTSTTWSRRSARTTPAPRSTTSTRRRCSGRSAAGAVDDVAALRRIERELLEQGYLVRDGQGRPRALAPGGPPGRRHRAAQGLLEARGRRPGRARRAGRRGRRGDDRRQPAWQFGDEQPLDVVRTVRNAVLRAGRSTAGVRLHVEDFEVVETERRTSAAVALLVDLSFSMELRGTWGTAKQTALALHSLVTTKYPQDSIEIIGFSDYAQVLTPERLAGSTPSACRARTCSTPSCSPAATSASTPTASRSSWS